MLNQDPETSRWLSLTCPGCRCLLRIKSKYAHLRGRCPECGFRIDAPRPSLQRVAPSADAGNELALIPIEAEWPEPALLEDGENALCFAKEETILNAAAPFTPYTEEPSAEPYPVESSQSPLPKFPPAIDTLSEAEKNPLRAPPPPAHPLLQGVYFFPWRPEQFAGWLFLFFAGTVLAALASLILYFVSWLQAGSRLGALAVLYLPILCIGFLWTGSYAAVYFLLIIEETAAGNDRVRRPDWTIMEGLGKLFFLLWLMVLAAMPGRLWLLISYSTASVISQGWLATILSILALFPILLLSALSSRKPWYVWSSAFFARLACRPNLVLAIHFPTTALVVSLIFFTYQPIRLLQFPWVLAVGLLGASTLFIQARVLGRVAWLLQEMGKPERSTKKRRKPAAPIDPASPP